MAKFKVTAVETVERDYEVEADDEKDARRWLNLHWGDESLLRDGVVVRVGDERMRNRRSNKVVLLDGDQPGDDEPE